MSRATFVRAIGRAATENLGLKVFALVVSVFLYSFIHGSEDAQRSVDVDVVTVPPPPDARRMLVSDVPEKVKLTLRGSRSMLNALRADAIEPVTVDLRTITGRYYYFERSDFEVPAGIQIEQIAPEAFALQWATKGEKRLDVVAHVVGDSAPGTRVSEVRVRPEEVVVRGPEKEVGPLAEATTSPVDVTGMEVGSHVVTVPLTARPNLSFGDDASVRVTVDVASIAGEREIRRVPVATVGPLGRVQIRPARVDVILKGPPGKLNNFDEERIVPYVDTSELTLPGARPLPVHIRGVPDNLEVVAIEPSEVLVSTSARR